MGILDGNCNNILFPMECDLYYAAEDQDGYGAVNKDWRYDGSALCSLYNPSNTVSSDNFAYSDNERFYLSQQTIAGRFKLDPRKNDYGLYYPLSHILVTNIRPQGCGQDESFFIETDGDYVGDPTVFEIKFCQPFIGAFNKVEYYKVELNRSDNQELSDRASC